jgi:hypothetical protein
MTHRTPRHQGRTTVLITSGTRSAQRIRPARMPYGLRNIRLELRRRFALAAFSDIVRVPKRWTVPVSNSLLFACVSQFAGTVRLERLLNAGSGWALTPCSRYPLSISIEERLTSLRTRTCARKPTFPSPFDHTLFDGVAAQFSDCQAEKSRRRPPEGLLHPERVPPREQERSVVN